jgi:hypothetical protein
MPTLIKIEDSSRYPRIEMTYESPTWDPYSETLSTVEETLRARVGSFTEFSPRASYQNMASTVDTCLSSISTVFTESFDIRMAAMVRISEVNVNIRKSLRRKGTVTAEELARRWHIGLDTAKRRLRERHNLAFAILPIQRERVDCVIQHNN